MSARDTRRPDGRLEGKVAVITGTAGGQGRAAALLFARAGAKVVGADTDADRAASTVADVEAAGGSMVSLHPVDLNAEGAAEALVELALRTYGRLDVLYNNAAHTIFSAFADHTWEAWDGTITGELHLTYRVTRAAWPHLLEAGGATVINVGSITAHRGTEAVAASAHGAAKAAVLALTRQLALEGASAGIRVNSITPGFIRTPVTAELLTDADAERAVLSAIPLGRVGEAEDIAWAALFLASDESGFITGTDLAVDGGALAVMR